jgi:surface protein
MYFLRSNSIQQRHWSLGCQQGDKYERYVSWCNSIQQRLGQWDVGSVTDMSHMFHDAAQFNQDIGQWDVSSVTNMGSMFLDASQFDSDLSRWNVSKVMFRGRMFHGATRSEGVKLTFLL